MSTSTRHWSIAHLTPGTGSFFCGSCLRDHALVGGLRERGHDTWMVPLYLPFVLDENDPILDERVYLGGINMYLQHKARWFGRLPRWLTRWLDSPGLLRWSSRQSDMTDAAAHAEMTLSTLRGMRGNQVHEFRRLVEALRRQRQPDVVLLSNAMLLSVARPLREALECPVVCALQGEDPFLDAFAPAARDEAWRLLRDCAEDADAFVAVSRWHGEQMAQRLNLPPERLHVVHNGLSSTFLATPDRQAKPAGPTVGYLARFCPDKGFHTLVDAFVELARRDTVPNVRLHAAGSLLPCDRRWFERCRQKLLDAGLGDRVALTPDLDPAAKPDFLRRLSVLSVPATYGESFGLYLLEALAYGIPVVQPRHAAFPELIEATGGGVLCEPDDPASLADSLEQLLQDEDRIAELGRRGREAVDQRFSATAMARGVEAVLNAVLSPPSPTAIAAAATGTGAPRS